MKRLLLPLFLAASLATADPVLEIAVPFIAEREGWRGEAYCDESGHATIGYGRKLADDCDHLGSYWPEAEPESREWLRDRAAQVLDDVRHHVTVPLDWYQEAALVSWSYNVGVGAMEDSKLLLLINSGAPHGVVVGELLSWDKEHRGGRLVRSRGLSERRALEAVLYLMDWYESQSSVKGDTAFLVR